MASGELLGVLRRRASRRAAMRGAALSSAGLAFAIACGSSNNNKKAATTATSAAPAPSGGTPAPGGGSAAASPAAGSFKPAPGGKQGGEYRTGFTGPWAGVDPHNSVYGGSGLVPIIYNYLVRTSTIAPDIGILPELATAWESAPDNLSVTFKLRPNAMIAENKQNVPVRPMDAEDAKASFERVADPKAASNGYSWIHDWVDHFEAVDKTTFKVVTKAPYAWVLNNVGNNLYSAVVPKEWLLSPDLKKTAVGSGPFMLQSLEEGGKAIVVRNHTYWEPGLPLLNQITGNSFADQATYRTAFTSKQIDVYGATDVEEAKAIAGSLKGSQRYEDPGFGFNSFWMNVTQKPWDDPRIRKAVRRAINPDEYIQLIAKGLGKQIGPLSYAMKGYTLPDDELKKLMPFSIQDAKQILQAAGQPNLTFKFQHPTSSNVADYVNIFVRQLAAAGITAQPEPQDAGTWVAGYFTNKLSASLSLNQEYANPDFALHWFTTGGITGNSHYDTGFSDPEVDAAVKKAAGTIDETARKAAYQDAQRLIISKDPPFWNFYGSYVNIVVGGNVVNYPHGIGSLGYYYTKNISLAS
ncbi:MAG TPA: ABC transporter substrate-binding protein [Dehalococcoidia bacterium]|nr:ABC transporter substrate-binding protein [Dehalococcoidia bacterium]